MEWPRYPLSAVAPPRPAEVSFQRDDVVWLLTLDQIQSHTGTILEKPRRVSGSIGNSTFTFDTGHVLYSKLRPYLNKVVCPDEAGIATTELIPLRPRKAVLDRRYLAHYLRSPGFLAYASQYVTGAKMPRVISDRFWEHEIPIPSLSEQCRIVEILEQADRLRRLRAETDATADRILPVLFIKIFGDPGCGARGTNFARLDSVVDIGGPLVNPNSPEYLDFPHVGGEHIEKETGRLLPLPTVRESRLRSAKFFFTERHVLYSKIRPYLNKVTYPRRKGLCSADIYPLLPKDERIGPWYLVALLRSSAFLSYARGQSDRLRMPKLNRDQLGSYSVPVPAANISASFEDHAEAVVSLDEARLQSALGVSRLFELLLHRAFSGELTVSWRQAHTTELLQEMEHQAKALDASAE